jgi:hypothetical protein
MILVAIGLLPNAAAMEIKDSRVKVVSPSPQQRFAPGDTVSVLIAFPPDLKANDVVIWVSNLGVNVKGVFLDRGHYQAKVSIPIWFAGSFEITPELIDAASNNVGRFGQPSSVSVAPRFAPMALTAVRGDFLFERPGDTQQLYVHGTYLLMPQVDLSSSASGTNWRSDNPQVVCVDGEGLCKALKSGTAKVTATNHNVSAVTLFQVGPARPEPTDVTNHLSIKRGSTCTKLSSDLVAGHTHFQDLAVQNVSQETFHASIGLVLYDLPAGVYCTTAEFGFNKENLAEKHNIDLILSTERIAPLKRPYFWLRMPSSDSRFKPGEIATVRLHFFNKLNLPITYKVKAFVKAEYDSAWL